MANDSDVDDNGHIDHSYGAIHARDDSTRNGDANHNGYTTLHGDVIRNGDVKLSGDAFNNGDAAHNGVANHDGDVIHNGAKSHHRDANHNGVAAKIGEIAHDADKSEKGFPSSALLGESSSSRADEVPDGGYGWLIVFGSSLAHFLIVGFGRSFGVFYLALLDKFGQSSSATAWVIALHLTIRQVLGPVSGLLVDRFSCRAVVMIGGLLMLIGCVISAFATSLIFLYLSFGVLAGLGSSFIFTPSYIIVGQYFDRRKGKAMGISTLGSGLGSIALAPLLSALLSHYGYWGAMLISGALMANNIVAGALFRPVTTKHSRLLKQKLAGDELEVSFIEKTKRALSVLKNITFVAYGLQITSMAICLQTYLQFLPSIGIENNAEPSKAAFLLSVVGIVDIISRFLWGIFFDLERIRYRRRLFHAFLGISMATASICTGFMTSYAGLMAMAVVFAFFEGGFHSQRATVVSEFVSKDQMSSTVGFVIFFQGFGNMLGPPVAGAIRDATGSYSASYYFSGSMLALTCTLFLANYAVQSCRAKVSSKPV